MDHLESWGLEWGAVHCLRFATVRSGAEGRWPISSVIYDSPLNRPRDEILGRNPSHLHGNRQLPAE